MRVPHIVVLGGGPAGVGAAYQLGKLRRAQVTLLEQQDALGGNAGSFVWQNQRLDYGSHRLHPACEPNILTDIRALLGAELLDRPRHGRIRLRGRWIHFPLKPVDLIRRMDPAFGAGIEADMVRKTLGFRSTGAASFADVLQASLGRTICRDFYFPYAQKIWGVSPEALSGTQAQRRVSANSFGKLIRKVASQIPGFRPPGSGRFYYPREGFGQITEALAAAAQASGADIRLGASVTALHPPSGAEATWRVEARQGERDLALSAHQVWSTLPVTLLPRLVQTHVPQPVLDAASNMQFRAMILIYLALPVARFTEFDAHYFQQANVRITRLSEPKNYAEKPEPAGRTVICAELPCRVGDEVWNLSDGALGTLVTDDLTAAGIPLPVRPSDVHVRRLRQAYPIYLQGYEAPFETLTTWVRQLPSLVSFGRQGLFAHDNTHHALAMAYGAADCVDGTRFDVARWEEYLRRFATHVVED